MKEFKYSLYWSFFYILLAFGVYWGGLLTISFWNGSMIEVDLGTTLALIVVAAMYWINGGGLIIAIEKLNGESEESNE